MEPRQEIGRRLSEAVSLRLRADPVRTQQAVPSALPGIWKVPGKVPIPTGTT